MYKNKEIHFYKDIFETENRAVYRTHNGTIEAIERDEKLIRTYAISALNFAYLLDKGYTIVLHENNLSAVCHEGTTCLTDKELRKEHDIRRIWIGGGFNGYFYANTQIKNPYEHE
jgi:hypothetical protein